MTTKAVRFLAAICLCSAALLTVSTVVVVAGPYSPCHIPPVVGVATRPNVMIIMDYSGSMQFPAYFDDNFGYSNCADPNGNCPSYYNSRVGNCNNPNQTAVYNPTFQYYGTFDPDMYYVYDTAGDYFVKADPQPVSYHPGTAETEDGGSGTIWLTCDGHDFQVNDYVAVYDLGSHKSLNGDGHRVLEVNGSRFKISATWNGKPDPPGYKAIKRITGNVNVGISGNVLNLAVTSRIDAALKALIGGKATTVSGDDSNVYVQAQGARRFVTESTNVNASFYVRPATLESSSTFPDDYQTGSYTDKDIFVTISGQYRGQLDPNDPNRYNKRVEPWTFTLTRTTQVSIRIQSTWSSSHGVRLAIYDNSSINNPWLTDVNGNACSSSVDNTQTTTLTVTLGAGTYYLRVATNDETIPANDFTASYDLWSTVPLQKHTGLYTEQGLNPVAHQGQALTKIGAIPWARVRIQMPKDERKGLIHEAFPYVRFGFMYYKGDVKANKGKILVGCDNTDIDRLISAMEGKDTDSTDGLDFTQAFPYGGTPTGPALAEVYDYFNQHNNSDHADNSLFVSSSTKGTLKDPFFGADASGKPVAVPCRKSFALLLSDGVWNDGVDPVNPAVSIHTTDLRPESQEAAFVGDQVVDIYSILAFSQEPEGDNSMRAIAMYGSFRNVTGCGNDNFPYPKSGTPSDSKNFQWPVPECDPNYANCNPPGSCSGTRYYNVTCCKEWDAVWDRDGDGVNENKGIPDAYYKANNGKELQAALKAVLDEVVSRTASASAVATVSQELRTGDIIVRGVFEAADPERVDAYLWRGHLEAFRPFMYDNKEWYSFELSCNAGRLCLDMPGTDAPCPGLGSHCTDAGGILSNSTTPASRTIFTYDPTTKTQLEFTSPTITKTMLGVSTDTEAQNLIDWVRGSTVTGYRDRRGWLLGDIVYSTPVVLGPPTLGEVSRRDPDIASFYEHRNANIYRDKVVYVGANDGQLHAFLMGKYDSTEDKWIYDPAEDSEIMTELWSYIPSNLLTELKALADTTYGQGGCAHRTMVDLAPRSWEVYINPLANRPDLGTNPCGSNADSQGRCWRSVIVGGERGGGDVYFAIDVTDPRNPIVLWEYPVLKNRVVVEVVAAQNPQQCRQDCYATCTSHSNPCYPPYETCYAACASLPRSQRNTCRGNCTAAYNACVDQCKDDCDTTCAQMVSGERSFVPFRDVYESIKMMPMSWSQPYLGRIQFPTNVKFYVGDPSPLDMVTGGLPSTFVQFDENNNRRAIAFMGGGLHVYDKSFDTIPTVADKFKLGLFWPFFLMLDIETGHNLFEYVWPVVINRAATNFPLKTSEANTIPYAMSDPIALDVWNQNEHVVGDDGFIDRIYVGDMNGYFYGIKFNLDLKKPDGTDNTHFGMQVDMWPTKEILKKDLDTNRFRSDHQPITLSAAATFEKASNDHLRVIIGAGKYDDVYTGEDDKSDSAKMSIYNIRDKVELPDVRSGYEIYDASHATNFKVLFQPKCDGVRFNEGCTWAKVFADAGAKITVCTDPRDLSTCYEKTGIGSRPDCCQFQNSSCIDPCFSCIFDLVLPETDGLPGERVVGKPLIAGGLVFLTTFVPPNDPCGYTGQGFLYAFDVNCVPILDPNAIFIGGGTAVGAVTSSGDTAASGIRYSLGSGVPSKPVLDSRGENIIVQMSDGTLKRVKVDLPVNPISVKGWRVR
ncbi:MAG: PilC/PilY family type IV pilus protein [Thermodesulfobacteriota bacterium]